MISNEVINRNMIETVIVKAETTEMKLSVAAERETLLTLMNNNNIFKR